MNKKESTLVPFIVSKETSETSVHVSSDIAKLIKNGSYAKIPAG